ncbi:uncharacterized protein METZ01_LOCUS399633, partial [marine metagenome]
LRRSRHALGGQFTGVSLPRPPRGSLRRALRPWLDDHRRRYRRDRCRCRHPTTSQHRPWTLQPLRRGTGLHPCRREHTGWNLHHHRPGRRPSRAPANTV